MCGKRRRQVLVGAGASVTSVLTGCLGSARRVDETSSATGGSEPTENTDVDRLESVGSVPEEVAIEGDLRFEGTALTATGQLAGEALHLRLQTPDGKRSINLTDDGVVLRSGPECSVVRGSSDRATNLESAYEQALPDHRLALTNVIDGTVIRPGAFASEVSANGSLLPSETVRESGRDLAVYERSPDSDAVRATVRYYVGPESGFLERLESETTRWKHHSWEVRRTETLATTWRLRPLEDSTSIPTPDC